MGAVVRLLAVLLAALALTVASVEAAWWDPSWARRVEVVVSNPGPPLRDCQVLIELPPSIAGPVRPVMDGEPLRYWVEGGGRLWVKLPELPSGTTRLHVYFGNPLASDRGSGAEVFDFFDGFDGPESLEGWSMVGGEWRVVGGALRGSTLGLGEYWDMLCTRRSFESASFEWYGRFTGPYAGVALVVDEATFYYVMARIPFYSDFSYGVHRAGEDVELGSGGRSDQGLHLYRLDVANGRATLYVDGVEQLSFNVSRPIARFAFIMWDGVEAGVEVHWFRVRRAAGAELAVKVGVVESHAPTISMIGAEAPIMPGRPFWLNVTVWDPASDVERVDVELRGLATYTWRRGEGVVGPTGPVSLVDYSVDVEGEVLRLCLRLKLSWEVEVEEVGVAATAIDSAGLRAHARRPSAIAVAREVYFKSPKWCAPGGLVNVTGVVAFKGLEAPAGGLEVSLRGEGASYRARTGHDGSFRLTFRAPSEVGKHVYTLSLMGEERLVELVVDRVSVSWYVDREEVRAGERVTFIVLLSYEYDGKPVERYRYVVYKDGRPLGAYDEPRFTDVLEEPGIHVYEVAEVVDYDRGVCCFTDPGDIVVRCSPPAYLHADVSVEVVNGWLSSEVDVVIKALSGGGQDVAVALYVDGEPYGARPIYVGMAPSAVKTSFTLDLSMLGYRRIRVVVEPTHGVKAVYETRALVMPHAVYVGVAACAVAMGGLAYRRARRGRRAYEVGPAPPSTPPGAPRPPIR